MLESPILLDYAVPISNLVAVGTGILVLGLTARPREDAGLEDTRIAVWMGATALLVAIGVFWAFEILWRLILGQPDETAPASGPLLGSVIVVAAGAAAATAALALLRDQRVRTHASAYANGANGLLVAAAIGAAALPDAAATLVTRALAEAFYASMILALGVVAFTRHDLTTHTRRGLFLASSIAFAPTVCGVTISRVFPDSGLVVFALRLMPAMTIGWWYCLALYLWDDAAHVSTKQTTPQLTERINNNEAAPSADKKAKMRVARRRKHR